MEIRRGTVTEMYSLWYEQNTSEFFADNIESGNAEFWTVEDKDRLIGELYIFFDADDKEFADGKEIAYLCAFRIAEAMRGKGLGTLLICRVFERLKELGYSYATIGVDTGEERNIKLYNKLGFLNKVKSLSVDPFNVDSHSNALPCEEYMLLKKCLI